MTVNLLRVRVARKILEAKDICSYELVSAEGDGVPLPSFTAGAHIDVHVKEGIIRQYSLCGSLFNSEAYLIAVLRETNGRGGSKTMHDFIKEGDVLTISHPRNQFELAESSDRALLLAGGIGITPILPMAERLHCLGRQFELHYCARSSDRAAFRERITKSFPSNLVHFHFDDGAAEQHLHISSVVKANVSDSHLYVCGPNGFMSAVLDQAKQVGWRDSHLHFENFGAQMVEPDSNQEFEIELAKSGRVILVPKNKSVVQALADSGVLISVSCEQGICGTCVTRVLQGIPDHRDLVLSEDEKEKNDQFLPCCSRSKSSRLVLDI